MKIGPFTLTKGKPQKIELGATGTAFFAGQLAEEEYNPDLRGEKAINVFEKMRRSDGQVKAALLACELPLRAARWDIQAASDSSKDQEIASFVRQNLFDWMTITWDDFLRHILLMLPFGFSMFEKVWELKDGKYRWRKLAPRLPRTLHEWDIDAEGGLKGIKQATWKGGSYVFPYIPVEKLIIFSLGREGSNYRGTSLLRAAYKHWYYKDVLYRIDGIAAERHGVGIAVFTLPPTATEEGEDSDYGKINRIGQSLHTHERSYVALPNEYGFDLKGVTGQLHDIIRSIEHHDMQIVRSILAQFINLGASEVGSYALSQDQSGFFLMALRAVGVNICDTMNRYAINQLVDYNWDVEHYPKLVVSGLEQRDIGVFAKAVADFVTAGVILPDRQMEAEVRTLMRLPPAKQKEEKTELRLAEFRPTRHPRGAETHVSFAEINDKLNTSEEEFVAAAKKIQERQIPKIVDQVVGAVEKGNLDQIPGIDVPYREAMGAALEEVLVDLFEYGREQVKEELKRQRESVKAQEPPPLGQGDVKAIAQFIKVRAKATASVLGSKLRAAMAWEALRQIKTGVVNRAAMTTALTAISDKELVATAKFSVSEAFNLGRQAQAKDSADEIDHVVYSALMDEHTCGPCGDLDGREFKFDSEWDSVAPPYSGCEGQDRCRCVGVFVYKSERR